MSCGCHGRLGGYLKEVVTIDKCKGWAVQSDGVGKQGGSRGRDRSAAPRNRDGAGISVRAGLLVGSEVAQGLTAVPSERSRATCCLQKG